nr:reverse transcriptase domain-containing protein [Tanacetum cinerariifolium]
MDSRDSSRGRGQTRTLSAPRDDRHKDKECLRGTRESYGDSFSQSYRDEGHHRHMKRKKDKSPPSSTPKEILATEASKFQPPPSMVTPVEKRSSNKFCDFHNDKGHRTNECMQLKKQIEELVRAGKLSYLIKEIKQGRDQSKTGKKETAAKDKPTAIYMVQSWQRKVKQKVTQIFKRVREIAFSQLTASNGTEGPLVIEAKMGGHVIHRMYIDGGSSMEILYKHCFNRLRPERKSQIVLVTTSLTGFSGETIWPLGQLRLLVTIGDATHSTKAWMNFMVVKSMSPYNGIIGRPGLKAIQAVPFTVHGMLKFPVEGGIATICSTILIPTECASVTTSSVRPREERTHLANFTVALHPDFPDQEVVLGGSLSDKGRTELCFVQKKNLDIFAWQPSDMTGVPRSIAEHQLNIQEGYTPVRQKKRCQAPEHARAIQAEVHKLVEAKIIREVYYHDWMSNSVMTAEAKQAFQQLKQHLSELPLLVAPKLQEELIMYLSATYGAVSAVLMTERGTTQTPIYFISRVLQGPELNYSPMEKLVMTRPDVAGRLQKWSIILGEHNITYRLRTSVKGQILADFLIEMQGDVSQAALAAVTQEEPWTLFSNGSSCVDGSGAGLILTNLEGVEFTYALRIQFAASNNEVEYEALVAGLRIATQMGVKNLQVNVDSKLVANQVLGTYVAKEDNMIKYLEIVKGLGIDKAGPFLEGPRKVKFLIVAMDYFTKWIEAKAVATITDGQVKKFVWDNNVCRLVIPVEIKMPTYRAAAVDVVNNDKELRLNLDLLEERRERTAVFEARAKSKRMKYYNARVRGVAFKPCDFVYRSNDASHAVAGGKLGPKWEGPYEVTEALGNGAYKLRSTDGTVLPRTWNVTNLK